MLMGKHFRWGKALTWGLLTLFGMGGVATAIVLLARPAHGEAMSRTAAPHAEEKVRRSGPSTLIVPANVFPTLGLEIKPVMPAQPGQGPNAAQDPKKKKGFFGKIAGIFKDDKSSAPESKPADSGQEAPH